MKKISGLLCCCLLSLTIWAQQKSNLKYAFLLIPDTLTENANQIIRSSERIFEIKSLKSGVLKEKKAITILNDESNANQFYIAYDKLSKVKKLEGSVYDKMGNLIRKVNKSDIKDISLISDFSLYEDDRAKVVEVVHNDYPYTVVWEYEQDLAGIPLIARSDWRIQRYLESVQQAWFQIEVPSNQQIKFKSLNLPDDFSPVVTEQAGKTIFSWSVSGLKAIAPESFGPPDYKVLPEVQVNMTEVQLENYKGNLESWEAYGAFLHQLYEGRDALPDDIVADVRNLVAGITDTEEKVKILYRYMQDKVRYVSVQLGIGGWQPFEAEYVSKNSYGDCKALSNFMKAMLTKAGIKSYPVIIKNGSVEYPVDPDFVKPRFNHVILYVPEIDYWLECTSSSKPANYIGASNMNRTVLLVTEEGGKLKRTPDLIPEENREEIKVAINLNEEGTAKVTYKSKLVGKQHERFRSLDNNYSKEEQEKWILKNTHLSNLDLANFELHAERDLPEAIYNYEGSVRKYASKAGKRIFVPINKVSVYETNLSKDSNRQMPIYHGRSLSENLHLEIELPENYDLETLPYEAEKLESKFATYELTIGKEGNKVIVDRKIILKPTVLKPSEYEAFRKFYKNISRREKAKLVLVEKKT